MNTMKFVGLFVYGMIFLLFSYSMQMSHIINMLIILESMMLVSIGYIFFSLIQLSSMSLFLLLLAFAASEAALGLSLMVMIIRLYSSDNLVNMSL